MALNHARGRDPHHARMPSLAGQHQPGRGGELLGELPAGPLGGIEHRPLRIAPLAVGPIQLGRDRRCPLAVRGQHQLHSGVGAVEASGGIDPGGDPEGQIALVEADGLRGGRSTQGPKPGAPRPSGDGKARANERAILAAQRDEVGDRGQRHEVELALGLVRPQERGRELVGDAGRAELPARIAAHTRVKDGTVGQSVPRLVVVCDDHLESGAVRGGDLIGAPDPAVGRQQEAGAAGRQPLHPSVGQPIPVAQAGRGCTSRSSPRSRAGPGPGSRSSRPRRSRSRRGP